MTFSEESSESAVRVSEPAASTIQAIPGGGGRGLVPGLIMMPTDNTAIHGGYHIQSNNGIVILIKPIHSNS